MKDALDCRDRLKLVSSTLGISERTVQRHLHRLGVGFRASRDALRQQRAAHLLVATEQSVTEIAAAVGFGGSTAFCRAFRRWFGVSPLQFRERERSSKRSVAGA